MLKNRMKIFFPAPFIALWLFFGSGCGVYSFSPGGKSSLETIAVAQFENETIEAGLASRMTDLMVDAFIADGNLKVASEDAADAVLTGILTSYRREPLTFDEADNVSQYVVKVTFDATLTKGQSSEEIWSEVFYNEGVYDAAAETEDDGQSRVAQALATDILNRTTRSW